MELFPLLDALNCASSLPKLMMPQNYYRYALIPLDLFRSLQRYLSQQVVSEHVTDIKRREG